MQDTEHFTGISRITRGAAALLCLIGVGILIEWSYSGYQAEKEKPLIWTAEDSAENYLKIRSNSNHLVKIWALSSSSNVSSFLITVEEAK